MSADLKLLERCEAMAGRVVAAQGDTVDPVDLQLQHDLTDRIERMRRARECGALPKGSIEAWEDWHLR